MGRHKQMTDVQTPPVGTEEKEVTNPQSGQETETPQTPPVEPAVPAQEPVTPATPQTPETPPVAPDYKEKFKNSQREAIVANERVNVANERIEQLTKTDTPTDEA